jgi:Zn-dependent peptidase ImmA (M78 family)/transcriptional regulator with XRE-family HTH domain
MLRSGRERAGLSRQAAAAVVGISETLLGGYEAGRRQPSLGVAAALAGLYGTSLAAGLEPSSADVSGAVLGAAPRELSERARAGVRLFGQRLADYVGLAGEMGTAPGGPGRSPLAPGRSPLAPGRSPLAPARTSGAREAERAARELRRHLDLGGGALGDPFGVLDGFLLAWRLPLGGDLDGVFCNHPEAGFCVVVNSELAAGRQVFALAHELAHACCHSSDGDAVVCMPGGDRGDRGSDRGRERFADAFAGEFLVPGDELRRVIAELSVFSELASPALIARLQRHFGVGFATLRARLRQEQLITRSEYDALASPERPVRGDEDYPGGGLLSGQPGRVLALVRAAVERSVITAGDAASVLGTSTEEVRQLLAGTAAGPPRSRPDLEGAALGRGER